MAKPTQSKPAAPPQQSRSGGGGTPFFSIAILIGLSALAVDALHLQVGRSEADLTMAPLLEPSDTRFRKQWTGFAPVDGLIVTLVVMFHTIFTGELPQLSLFSFYFAGQILSFMMLLIASANRQGKAGSWNITKFWATWSVFIQLAGLAVTLPIYCAIDLIISPTSPRDLAFEDPAQLDAIVPSFILGFVLPSALQLLPVSWSLHQILLAAWQPFPIYMSVVLNYVSNMFKKMNTVSGGAGVDKAVVNKRAATHAYSSTILAGAIIHWVTLAVIVAAAVKPDLIPGGAATAGELSFQKVFVPNPPHHYGRATIAGAMFQLLQYDLYISSTAAFIWVAVVSSRIGTWTGSPADWFGFARNILTTGPAAAVVALLWKRDEAAFAAL